MIHKIENLFDNDYGHYKRMEVPGGWIYMIYDYRYETDRGDADKKVFTGLREDILVSSVFVPKVK